MGLTVFDMTKEGFADNCASLCGYYDSDHGNLDVRQAKIPPPTNRNELHERNEQG